MRGEVEIWDGDKLLHKESNLLVNGAGELLADIMTVSPSLSGITDHATSSILDSSNYTIQAISFGKDASAYQYNAHALNSRRNLFYYSTPSGKDDDPNGQIWWTDDYLEVCSAPEILPPTKYELVPSATAHALSVIDISTTGNGGLAMSLGNATGATASWTMSGGQDNWYCFSVYLKSPDPDDPFHPYPYTSTAPNNKPHVKMQLNGENWNDDGFAKSRAATDPYYASPYFTTPSGVIMSFTGDDRSIEGGGYSISYWDQGGGMVEAGNGWYRAWTSVLSPVSGLSAVNTYLYPAGWEASPTGETSGSVYAYGWQLEQGRWPTDLQFNNQGFEVDNWDLSGSVLNRDHSSGAVEDNGTVRVLNEPIPNPNLLFYTDDPGNSPELDFPAGDTVGDFWQSSSDLISFSSILETDPFGGVSSMELSTGLIPSIPYYPNLRTQDNSYITSQGHSSKPRVFKEGYNSIFSFYIKKPPSLDMSAITIYTTDVTDSVAYNVTVIEFDSGTGIPFARNTSGKNTPLVEAVGNDWYRCSLSTEGLGYYANINTFEGDQIRNQILMGDVGNTGPHDSYKRVWISSMQLEQWPIGVHNTPTKYRAVSGNIPTSVENNLLTSSYTPTNYLSSPPNPESTRVEDGNTALLDTSSSLSGFNMGQNLNVIPYREQGDQLPNFFNAYLNYVDGGTQFDEWLKAKLGYSIDNISLSGTGSLGPQAYYLGCYPEGSSTGGSNWALVSSLDNSAAYLHVDNGTDPNFVSGTYNSIINEASSMDASGFVGKVYDTLNHIVGEIPNPNLLAYTVDPGNSPLVDIPAGDLDGTYWGADQIRVASYSSVEYTNALGGPSSMLCSGLSSWPDDGVGDNSGYGLCLATTNTSRIPTWPATSATTYIASIFVKRPTNGYETSSCMINMKDNTTPDEAYIAVFEFDGVVPSVKSSATEAEVTASVESYGDDWYRLQCRLDGSNCTTDTAEGDRMNLYFYGGDNKVGSVYTPSSNWAGKTLYAYGPQMEVYDQSLGFSATPYQSVAGISPTVAEQQGEGGLHVSGGIDATNSGTVEYSMLVGSGDVGYSNLYGGIYNMGLWTIDMDESIKAGNTPPYSFGPLNNPRKYKLFATKHLTKNLGYIVDDDTNAGSLNYTDLTIKWRLHFL